MQMTMSVNEAKANFRGCSPRSSRGLSLLQLCDTGALSPASSLLSRRVKSVRFQAMGRRLLSKGISSPMTLSFGRMRNAIIATGLISGMPIVTGDNKFSQYGVRTIC